mmetsp:Transcript_42027/g.125843  ORF Transcript_42027/g.125843 Transcript_42027/m.125843 type:complete len:216 (-) Transcript_42027:909-1556(-)
MLQRLRRRRRVASAPARACPHFGRPPAAAPPAARQLQHPSLLCAGAGRRAALEGCPKGAPCNPSHIPGAQAGRPCRSCSRRRRRCHLRVVPPRRWRLRCLRQCPSRCPEPAPRRPRPRRLGQCPIPPPRPCCCRRRWRSQRAAPRQLPHLLPRRLGQCPTISRRWRRRRHRRHRRRSPRRRRRRRGPCPNRCRLERRRRCRRRRRPCPGQYPSRC